MPVGNNGLLDGIKQIPAKLRALDILGGLPGAPLGFRLREAVKSGPPASGTWKAGDVVTDRTGVIWTCVTGGTPGNWAATAVRICPSGDATGVTDAARINAVISAGGAAVLAWTGSGTPFYTNTPLTPASGSSLRGAQPWMSSPIDNYGAGNGVNGGTVIQVTSSFSGAAVIDMTNATGTQYSGVTLADFTLNAVSQTTGHGMLVDGAWGACVMDGVAINGPFADVLHFQTDTTTSKCADDWRVTNCKFSYGGGYGVWADNLPDSWFTACESSANNDDNWYFGFSLNTRLVACKGEGSTTGAGYHLAGQGGGGRALSLTGCTTHANHGDGFLFDNSASGSSGGVYLLAGCYANNDNQAAGTTYAGYRSSGCLNRVTASACTAYGAAYGAYQGSTSAGMTFTGSDLSGATANTKDDGTNTLPLANVAPSGQQVNVTLGTTFNSATGTAAQNVTGMAVTLQQGTYLLRGRFWYTAHGTTGSTQTFAWTFGGTASAAQVSWQFLAAAYTAPVSGATITTSSGLSPTLTTTTYPLDFVAHVAVSAAGTLQLTVQSTTSGDEVSVIAGSYLDIEPAAA